MSDSSFGNRGASRRINTKGWDLVKKLVSVTDRDLSSMPHSYLSAFFISNAILAVTRAATVFSAVHFTDNAEAKMTRWFFDTLQEGLNIRVMPNDYLMAIAWCLLLSFFFKLGILALLVYLNLIGKSSTDGVKTIFKYLSFFFWLDTQTIPVVIVDLCILVIQRLSSAYVLISILCLILLPFEIAVNNLFSYDFAYLRSNLVQGRNYNYSTLCSVFTLISSIAYCLARDNPTYGLRTLVNGLHLGFAVIQIWVRLFWDIHFHSRIADRIIICFEGFYFWISISNFFGTIGSGLAAAVDFDYLTVFCLPLASWLLFNLQDRRSASFFEKTERRRDKEEDKIQKSLYKLERLYVSFLQQSDLNQKIELFTTIVDHNKKCVDPYCLCRLTQVPYDLDVGPTTSVHAREIYRKIGVGKGLDQSRKLTFFDDKLAIGALRAKHGTVVTAKTSNDQKKLEIFTESQTSTTNLGHIVSLDSNEDFSLVMASFLRGLLTKTQVGTQYEVIVANLAFLYSEYKNPMAVLLLAYEYIYSVSYSLETSHIRNIVLQNYVSLAKASLRNTESAFWNNGTSLDNVSLAEVLDFRERTHVLRFTVQDLIVKKIDLYNLLSQKVMDFTEVTNLGSDLYEKITKTQQEIDDLLDMSSRNSKLARLGVVFEMCVLERPGVSARLRKSYRESYVDVKNRVGSINSINTKFIFSPFNSSNIAVFVRNYEGGFRICKFTNNGVHLFGMAANSLIGQKITAFMPGCIGELHDQFIFSYLNGQSQNKHHGKFYVPVTTAKGDTRSTMMLIKPEIQFFDEIYMASLVSIRKKNHFPILFTDLNGKIIGTNKQAKKVVANNTKIHETALFAIFPRLFQYYFPAAKSSDFDITHSNIKEQIALEGETEVEEQTIDQEGYNYELTGELRGVFSTDLFLFQMLYKTVTTIADTETLTKTYKSFMSADAIDQMMLKFPTLKYDQNNNVITKLQLEALGKTLSLQRRQILTNLNRIYKSKIDVETNHFQRRISIREVTLDSIHRTRVRIQHFFKAFALNNNPYLMEILMVSPESLNNLYKLCSYRLKLVELKEQAGIQDDDNDWRPKAENVRSRSAMLAISKNRKNDENDQDGVPNRLAPFMTETQAEDDILSMESIPKETEKVTRNFIKKKSEIVDNVEIQPEINVNALKVQPSNSLGLELSKIDATPVSNIGISYENAFDEKKEKMMNAKEILANQTLIKEKIQKFNHMITAIKTELERDYDTAKIQKLTEIIISSLNVGGTTKTPMMALQALFSKGSQNSSRESVAGQSDFIEGVSVKIEDSFNSDQDSFEEVKYDSSDPLKTIVEIDQPSTFLNSSSRMSVKSSQDAILIRNSIEASEWRMIFRKWEYGMFATALLVLGFKILFKLLYDKSITDVYDYEVSINLISNILRPTAFIYKESMKGWMQQFVNLTLRDLPDKKVFYDTQLYHYQDRLSMQSLDLIAFYSKDLDMSYNFREGAPNQDFSIFSMSMELLNVYMRVYELISKTPDQEDMNFVFSSLPLWEKTRNIGREIFKKLYDNFVQQDASRSEKMATIYLFHGLNYGMNGVVILLLVLGTVYISRLIDYQLRQAGDLLLRIDKSLFKSAIKKFSRATANIEEGGKEKDEMREAVLVHIKHADVMNSESSVLLGGGPKRGKKNLLGSSGAASNISYSHLTNFPQRDTNLLALFAFILALLVNLPSIINFFMFLDYYAVLDQSLSTSTNINLVSSSFYYLAGIQYQQYVDVAIDSAPAIDPTLVTLAGQLESNIEKAKYISDSYLQDILTKTMVCEMVGNIVDAQQKGLCLKASETGQDYNMYQAMHDISLKVKLFNAEAKQATVQTYITFFQSSAFTYYDNRFFFLTMCLKEVSATYMLRILDYINSTKFANTLLLVLFCIMLPFSLVLYHIVWLPKRLKHWRKYRSTLLTLNDDVVNCIYIKSYFGQDSSLQ